MPGGKIIHLNFELKEFKISNDILIKQLNTLVKDLLKENLLMKNEIKLIKDELKKKNK